MKTIHATILVTFAIVSLVALGCGGGGDSATEKAEPKKSEALDKAALEELAEIQVEGFDMRGASPRSTSLQRLFTSTEKNEAGKDVRVTATIKGECIGCMPMELDAWKKQEERLREGTAKSVGADSNLVFEIDEIELPGGLTGVYTYKLAKGTKSRMNSYSIEYNDGVNQIKLVTACGGGFNDAESNEELLEQCPREQQLEAARKVFAQFAHIFNS